MSTLYLNTTKPWHLLPLICEFFLVSDQKIHHARKPRTKIMDDHNRLGWSIQVRFESEDPNAGSWSHRLRRCDIKNDDEEESDSDSSHGDTEEKGMKLDDEQLMDIDVDGMEVEVVEVYYNLRDWEVLKVRE
jgi:hypothetical protein